MSTFYERLMQVTGYEGIKNPKQLGDFLGYNSAEKLYRLERDQNAKPSFEVLLDISKKFDNIDMNWLISGEYKAIHENQKAGEEAETYHRITFEEIIAEKVADKIEPMLNQVRKSLEYMNVKLENISNKL